VYSFALIGMLKSSEDLVFNRQLSEIAGTIKQHIETHGKLPSYLPMHITLYQELSSVPSWLQDFVSNRDPGVFEINGDGFDYHAAIVPIESIDRTLYVFYDVGSVESTESFQSLMMLAFLAGGLGVLIMGWLLAMSVSNRILNPIIKLAGEVQSLSLDETTDRLHYPTTRDEIGTFVSTINRLLERISEFTRREREFTSHASHELRTPVTVIKGAVEILKGGIDKEGYKIQQPMSRIERAVSDMEKLIEAFLLLARQGEKPDQDEDCDLPEVIKSVVDTYRHILKNKPVEVKVRAMNSLTVQAPSSFVAIALGNLVRNAFMYTKKGEVRITLLEDRVIVLDSGPGIDPSWQGKGLGLTIVKRLCERMSWQFIITGPHGEGTRAELIFK
jgi:signal transduction histidine kinase